MSEYTAWLKVATCDLVLRMLEEQTVMRDLSFDNPIRAIREISHDLTGTRRIRLANGREMSALQIQQAYLERVERFVSTSYATDDDAAMVVAEWRRVLDHLENDPMKLARELDWVAKYQLIDAYRAKHDLPLGHPRVAMLDLAYHNVTRSRGLYYLLERQGRLRRLLTEDEITPGQGAATGRRHVPRCGAGSSGRQRPGAATTRSTGSTSSSTTRRSGPSCARTRSAPRTTVWTSSSPPCRRMGTSPSEHVILTHSGPMEASATCRRW